MSICEHTVMNGTSPRQILEPILMSLENKYSCNLVNRTPFPLNTCIVDLDRKKEREKKHGGCDTFQVRLSVAPVGYI